jgi:electron transport complex protein RnfE
VFGEHARQFVLHVLPNYQGFLLAILPPGAFIALGLLIAAHNWNNARAEQRARAAIPVAA